MPCYVTMPNGHGTKSANSFDQAKSTLVSSDVLVHYNPDLPIRIAGDASAYGVGAVLAHVLPDGSERPVAFASRTLTSSEKNYTQVEKEALSLIFAVKRFHAYLYGRSFTIVTDHKPLTAILGPKKGIPPLAATRLQRWAWILSAYKYEIEFRPTGKHGNADGLSRLPLSDISPEDTSSDPRVFNISPTCDSSTTTSWYAFRSDLEQSLPICQGKLASPRSKVLTIVCGSTPRVNGGGGLPVMGFQSHNSPLAKRETPGRVSPRSSWSYTDEIRCS